MKRIRTIIRNELKLHWFSLALTLIIIIANLIAFGFNFYERLYIIPERELTTFSTWYVFFTFTYFHSSFFLFLSNIIAFWWTLRTAENVIQRRKILLIMATLPPVIGLINLLMCLFFMKSHNIIVNAIGAKEICGLSPITLFLLVIVSMNRIKQKKYKKMLFFMFVPPFLIVPYYTFPHHVIIFSIIIEILLPFVMTFCDQYPRIADLISITLAILTSTMFIEHKLPDVSIPSTNLIKTKVAKYVNFLNILVANKVSF